MGMNDFFLTRCFAYFLSVIFGFLFFCVSALGGPITYQVKAYSDLAESLMKDDQKHLLYSVSLSSVPELLPLKVGIKRQGVKLIAAGKIPGKNLLKLVPHLIFSREEKSFKTTARDLFSSLKQGVRHTFVITEDQLIFARSTEHPLLKRYQDRFTKHFLLAGFHDTVHFAGEFVIFQEPGSHKLFVVIDNSSGTYQPGKELLPSVKVLFDNHFNRDAHGIYFVTKTFDQKIDTEKLFAHQEKPFLP